VDTTALYSLAARLDGHAEVVRARARLLAAHRNHLRWRSRAARRCRIRLDGVYAGLAACASQAEEVADRIRAHAARVQQSP
jgi:hypothetical protein